MFRIVYRQRRRILCGVFFICLSIGMALGANTDMWSPNSFGLKLLTFSVTLLICGLVFSIAAIFWLWLFPSWRFMIEQVSYMVFVYAAFDTLWPAHAHIPYVGSFLPFVVTFGTVMVVYGTTLDRFRLTLAIKQTRHFKSQKTPELLWEELVPNPENIETHWDGLLHSIEADENDARVQMAKYHHGASMFQIQRQEMISNAFPNQASYRFDGEVTQANKPITGGLFNITLEPNPDGSTRVMLGEEHDALLPRVALQMWFDDGLGDQTDYLRARETGKRDWSLTNLQRKMAATLS